MVRTVQILLHSQLACNEMQASTRTCGRHTADSMLENIGSIYFHDPSQDNSTNYYLILGVRDKSSQQIPSEACEEPNNTVIHFYFYFFFIHTMDQPIRGNDRPIGQMFPEHVERSFLDPNIASSNNFQLGLRRKVGPVMNQLASLNTSN